MIYGATTRRKTFNALSRTVKLPPESLGVLGKRSSIETEKIGRETAKGKAEVSLVVVVIVM